MKQLSQMIVLFLFGLSALQMIVAIGSTLIVLQIFGDKLLIVKWWKARKAKREIESQMWQIE